MTHYFGIEEIKGKLVTITALALSGVLGTFHITSLAISKRRFAMVIRPAIYVRVYFRMVNGTLQRVCAHFRGWPRR